MRLITLILGLVVILLGALPILVQQGIGGSYLNIIPNSGNLYQGLIVIVGIIIVLASGRTDTYRGLRYRR